MHAKAVGAKEKINLISFVLATVQFELYMYRRGPSCPPFAAEQRAPGGATGILRLGWGARLALPRLGTLALQDDGHLCSRGLLDHIYACSKMQAAQGSVSRGVRAGEQHEPSRKWLGKREWQDVRRACTLGANGNFYAAELHGVKLLFRWEKAHASPVESNGEKRTSTSERQTHGRPASAVAPAPCSGARARGRDPSQGPQVVEALVRRSTGAEAGRQRP